MRILVISQYFYPEQFRINDICLELQRRGHEVNVITGLPNYPEGEIFEGYENSYANMEKYHNIDVYRCKLRPRHTGTVNLIRNYISFAYKASKLALKIRKKYDVIYVYGLSPVTQAIPAIIFKKKYNVPIYYYCCDIWPESVRGAYGSNKQKSLHHPIYLIAKILTKSIYKNIDFIGTKCQEFIDYNADVCMVPRSKMDVIYEHAEDSYLKVNENADDNGIVDFMFLGNIGKAQNCDQLILSITRLKRTRPFKLHFVGDGSDLENLKQMVEKMGLGEIVIFHGKHPVSEVIKFYNLADVCLLSLSNRTKTGLTPPAKLVGYMAAARPIVASINGAADFLINDAKCGFCVKADDLNGLVDSMQKVIDNPDCIKGMGKNGRAYFKKYFTLNKHVDKLEQNLLNVVQSHHK